MIIWTTDGRIGSLGFSNTPSEPETMVQLYDPYKDALMLLFTDRCPGNGEWLPDMTPTYHDDVFLYLEGNTIIGLVILGASEAVANPERNAKKTSM